MIGILLGTRPEIIKMSPVIRELQKRKLGFFIVHSNQHFSSNMDKKFFQDIKLPKPKYNLRLKSRSQGAMVGELISKAEKIFMKEKPSVLLVQGDTNTVLAGGIAAWKLGIKVAHVEAGLRSYDREMPEEINRKITDHISDLLFCPTDLQKRILVKEDVDSKKIFVTGNTIVDAVYQNTKILPDLSNRYIKGSILLTLHRPSNVDNKATLTGILSGVEKVAKILGKKIYFPIHPRTKINIEKFEIKLNKKFFYSLPPLGYFDMLFLEKHSNLIFTDSGGVQEEACILKTPCITIRENTERPETIKVGSNILAGTKSENIVRTAEKILKRKKDWLNPFGDGNSAKRIISILEKNKMT
ncbi:MAG TPA: UDP-N-acetylglucosamine 2-epimerase (non-hydrolyzing) [Patescibacteria group bacterium]|nr:UDP-N-acetylglucosamine 2-epimerase (non-hydrolyzing) [Patescibacteria group bacterium]